MGQNFNIPPSRCILTALARRCVNMGFYGNTPWATLTPFPGGAMYLTAILRRRGGNGVTYATCRARCRAIALLKGQNL